MVQVATGRHVPCNRGRGSMAGAATGGQVAASGGREPERCGRRREAAQGQLRCLDAVASDWLDQPRR